MKKIIGFSVVIISLIFISGCSLYGTSQSNPSNTPPVSSQSQQPSVNNSDMISIQNFTFSPATLTVKKGATVTWTNNDPAAHTIKSNSFNSGSLAKGDTFKFTFDSAGTFDYSCGIHPSMLGKIIVE